jgi:phosphatidylserine/phosphatidylglycerophosphate/cardiolipin synthase-like enzyme
LLFTDTPLFFADCAFITSANFTERGQSRNFEAGVEIEDEAFAQSLVRQWQNLIDEEVLVVARG